MTGTPVTCDRARSEDAMEREMTEPCEHWLERPWFDTATVQGEYVYVRLTCPVCTKSGEVAIDLLSVLISMPVSEIAWSDGVDWK